tara:strand:+ start:817 stop:1488 length:672 start_codon:yes stop_codon:yes gene_type:complete
MEKTKQVVKTRLNERYNYEQRTKEWLEIKQGKISSSNSDRIMKQRGLGVGGETYCMEIVATAIQEHFEPGFVSHAMQQGIDREPLAAEIYEEEKMCETSEVGFIVFYTEDKDLMDISGFIGVSPDRLVGEDGGLEIKCPEPAQHTRNLAEEVCSAKYYDQIQTCLFVTGRKWWDLMTFNPDFKEGYKWKITRNYPDIDWQYKFIERAKLCKKIVAKTLETIKK